MKHENFDSEYQRRTIEIILFILAAFILVLIIIVSFLNYFI